MLLTPEGRELPSQKGIVEVAKPHNVVFDLGVGFGGVTVGPNMVYTDPT